MYFEESTTLKELNFALFFQLSFTNSEIRENMRALFTAIESHKPESVKRGTKLRTFAILNIIYINF